MAAGIGDREFLWAVGIEDTFIPQVRPGMRRLEEYELTQHYRFWREDLDRAADSGATGIRWGLPWYRVEPTEGSFDWRWTDRVLEYAVAVKGLTVILDLVHYGTPLWMDGSFVNGRYPEGVAAFAGAAAARYRALVRHYMPVNEPMVGADWSGRLGRWPPYLTGDDGLVRLTLALARGTVLTAEAIRAAAPEAVLVQVEATHVVRAARPEVEETAARRDEEQFLCFDLATGRAGADHPMRGFLVEHGATEAELGWFERCAVTFDVFGLNYYPWSNVVLTADGAGRPVRRRGETGGGAIAAVARRVHERYRLPIMITETSAPGSIERRARWMDETIAAVADLRASSVPVVGYTWFPLFTMIDWAYRSGRRPLESYILNLGLYDGAFDARAVLRRTATPLVERYRGYTQRPPAQSAAPR